MTSFVIQRARARDISPIRSLVKSRIVNCQQHLPQPKVPLIRTGLLDYKLPTLEAYLSRISSQSFFIARDVLNKGKIIGMIDAYDSRERARYFLGEEFLEILNNEFGQNSPFVYINSVAVAHGYERRGIATLLLKKVEGSLKSDQWNLLSTVIHKPIKNEYSASMFTNRGFCLAKEMTAYGFVFGVYRKSLTLH